VCYRSSKRWKDNFSNELNKTLVKIEQSKTTTYMYRTKTQTRSEKLVRLLLLDQSFPLWIFSSMWKRTAKILLLPDRFPIFRPKQKQDGFLRWRDGMSRERYEKRLKGFPFILAVSRFQPGYLVFSSCFSNSRDKPSRPQLPSSQAQQAIKPNIEDV
jgi:hypothetical protein